MALRWTIMLAGSLLVAAVGGTISGVSSVRAPALAEAQVSRGSTPDLDAARRLIVHELDGAVVSLAGRAERLELLANLLADAARRRVAVDTASVPVGLVGR